MLEERKCPLCGALYSPPTQYCHRDGKALEITSTLIGRVLHGKYRIEDWLGGGGMATVYRATHLKMGEEVAVKVLNPSLVGKERIVDRFRNEARAALRINHPNAIKVTDFDVTDDNLFYIVMEIVHGRLLREMIGEKIFDYRRTVKLLYQACEAIYAAHQQGIIHRDLKPDNIIVQNREGNESVKVLDFGIARLREPENQDASQSVKTKPGTLIGTWQYMSPEQARGEELGPASDVYSLGVIGYEMLCGRTPFIPTSDGLEYIRKIQIGTPPLLRAIEPSVPVSIERVIMRALDKSPDRRQSSALALAQELRKAVKEADGRPTDPSKSTSTVIEERQGESDTLLESSDEFSLDAENQLPTLVLNRPRRPWILIATLAAAALGMALYLILAGKIWRSNQTVVAPPPSSISDENGEMMLIRGGNFKMGRNDGEQDESPEHEVDVKDFYLDKYEVTNQQYKKFVDATGHRAPAHWVDDSYPPAGALLPVTHVTWSDAVAYANWAKKRLPTEKEWEYAARGGKRELLYPWGNVWNEGYANTRRDGSSIAPVGSFEKDVSPFGVFDLAGNVSEWVQDHSLRYLTNQPFYPKCSECRVYRGGNFIESKVTNTYRWSFLPEIPADAGGEKEFRESVFPKVGFRCARDVSATR